MAFVNIGAFASLAALASATSANGTARNGTAQSTLQMQPGILVAQCSATIVTGSVVATFKFQGSDDNSTYVDLHGPENVAYVTVTATGTTCISAPIGFSAFKYVRAVATLSGATTAAGDLTSVTTRWLRYGELE